MQQYFIDFEINNSEIILNKEQQHHIKNVLRMKEGTQIRIVDTKHELYIGNIQYIDNNVKVISLNEVEADTELPIQITLIAALIKKDKWDFLIQKVSELGVHKIVGLQTQRTVVKLEEKKAKKIERWNKICLEACEQSRRTHCSYVEDIIDISQLQHYRSDLNVVAYEDSSKTSASLATLEKNINSITIVIGPEGGFSIDEIDKMKEFDFIPITLGKRILRAETAAIAAVNTIGVLYEENN